MNKTALKKTRQIDQLDQEITKIADTTAVKWSFFSKPHNWLRQQFSWYSNWHVNNHASLVHQIILIIFILFVGVIMVATLGGGFLFSLLKVSL